MGMVAPDPGKANVAAGSGTIGMKLGGGPDDVGEHRAEVALSVVTAAAAAAAASTPVVVGVEEGGRVAGWTSIASIPCGGTLGGRGSFTHRTSATGYQGRVLH